MMEKYEKLTREELEELLLRYKIGKKPLAKLLGWGETTVLIYSQQEDIPDNEFTRKLKRLYRNPGEYLDLLKANRTAVSEVAYNKSLAAVRRIYERTDLVMAALEVKNCYEKLLMQQNPLAAEEMSLARLEAILFWSQVFSLSFHSKALFEDDYQPGRSGMPFRALEERINEYGCIEPDGLYASEETGTSGNMSDEQSTEIIMAVTRALCWYGPAAIDSLNEAERFRLCGPKGARRRRIVSKEMLKSCYSEVFAQMKVKQPKDIEGYFHKRITFVRKSRI